MPPTAPRTSGMARMRSAAPAGKPLPGPQLSQDTARAEALAGGQFDKQAAEYAKPTDRRPALIVEAEIEHLRRTISLPSERLTMLVKVYNIRYSVWQEEQGETPLDAPNATDRDKATKFFDTHGRRLADAPRVAPPNPLKAAEPAPTPASVSRAEAARRQAEAADQAKAHAAHQAELAEAAARTKAAAAVATPSPIENTQPPPAEPAELSAQALALLHQLVAAGQAQAKQITELRADVVSLREQLASQPAPAASAAGETFTEFVMDAVAIGTDDKTFEATYKARGPQYKTHGVRVWPEILPELGLDESKLKPGLHKLPKPLKVRALMKLGDDGELHPNKVVGLAK